jgi:hypothetical protein
MEAQKGSLNIAIDSPMPVCNHIFTAMHNRENMKKVIANSAICMIDKGELPCLN